MHAVVRCVKDRCIVANPTVQERWRKPHHRVWAGRSIRSHSNFPHAQLRDRKSQMRPSLFFCARWTLLLLLPVAVDTVVPRALEAKVVIILFNADHKHSRCPFCRSAMLIYDRTVRSSGTVRRFAAWATRSIDWIEMVIYWLLINGS